MTMRAVALGLVSLTCLVACRDEGPTSLQSSGQPYAAARAAAAGGVTVTATNPPQASQDTSVDVTISGSGFARGARAAWSLAGDTTQVHVKSTRYVSSTQLVASVVVPLSAPVASYDVVVMLSDGKKGVGAELFAVTEKDPMTTFRVETDPSLGLRGDGLYLDGTASVYANGVCGVYSLLRMNATGDVTFETSNNKYADRKCPAWPRKFILDYGDGTVQSSTVFVNVRELQKTTTSIPIGTTVTRGLHVNESRCNGLVWQGSLGDGTNTGGADSVLVTRTAGDTWHVETQPYPDNEAFCKANGQKYHIAVRFDIVAERWLP